MLSDRSIKPSSLSIKDLPWQILWNKDKCTLCGSCTAVCPVHAIELGAFRKRTIRVPDLSPSPSPDRRGETPPSLSGKGGGGLGRGGINEYSVYHGIRQRTDPGYACIGCAMCSMVCPNDAILPIRSDEKDKLKFHIDRGGQPRSRGGRRNNHESLLDQIKFIRISMLTDPALDAGRHEFEIRSLLGRVLSPEENLKFISENGWIPPVREIYPLIIGSMSFGALSPNMWEGLQLGVTYLNEEMGMPVRVCTGEGGCPPRLLRSRFLKYVILQIASGYFGWDEIIHAIPDMKVDPCAIEIKYGQGAKPGDGGLLMWYKVNKLIAAIRGVPKGVSLPSPPTHQTQYSIEESVAKMIQSMYMAWGFRVPVYPKISGTSTALAVLNNLARNPYAGGLAIDGEDGGTGAAYNISMNHMGHPIASNIRDCYLNLVKVGMQNEIPIFAGGGIGKNGNLAANAAALIMLGASGIQIGKYIMQAAAGCLGSESDRCNICNIGLCPKGITSQDPRLYRRLDVDEVAQRVVDVFLSFDTELKKIVAPLGRSTSLPIGMSDALGIGDYNAAERLSIQYVV
ncbi:MAG: glutamate synthase [Desulfobacteraceae bacterium IS3]|nr:MAG: glutamate synthase [Desulfobacteraceae bacterium IS3]